MKKLFLIILLLTVLIGKSQTVFWINNITSSTGQVTIPVYVSGFDSIGTVALGLQYSPNLTFMGSHNVNANLGSALFNNLPGEVVMASFSLDCMTIPDSTIAFELLFNFTGGIGVLAWDLPNCGVGSCGQGTGTTTFINGYINSSLGLNEFDKPVTRCYPNPTTNFVNLNRVYNNVNIYSIWGVKLEQLKNVQRVNLVDYNPGVYVLELENIGKFKILRK